jgi:hypothetical protein
MDLQRWLQIHRLVHASHSYWGFQEILTRLSTEPFHQKEDYSLLTSVTRLTTAAILAFELPSSNALSLLRLSVGP